MTARCGLVLCIAAIALKRGQDRKLVFELGKEFLTGKKVGLFFAELGPVGFAAGLFLGGLGAELNRRIWEAVH